MKRPPAAAAGGGQARGFSAFRAAACYAQDLSAALGITQLFLLSYLGALAAGGAALPTYPAGANKATVALHMLRNAPWYLFVRPTLARDWALLGCALDMYGVPLLLLVLGAAGRRSALWRWWAGGARDWVMLAHAPVARTLLHAATYVLLPRHRWTQAGYALSTISAVTRPVENTLFLTVYCWYVPIRFSLAVPLSVANLVFTFLMAYVVGPVLLSDEGSAASAQLLSRLPLMRQALVAVVAAACPALAAWVAEKQLRAGYARVRQHPESFEQYGTRLAASTAASLLGATSGASVTGCVVVQGCAQLIAWRHSLRRPAEDGGGGGGDGVWSLSGLLPLLPQLLPDAELVGGVSVQAQAGAEREGGAERGIEVRRWSPSASSSAPLSAPVRLLHLQPPALALLPPAGAEAKGAGAAGMGAEACGELRVTVASPRAQRCRLLLLGSGGVVLAEYGTELAAGEQELRVGVADVLRAAEAVEVTSGQAPLALRLALVPPAHSDEGGPGSSDGPLLHFSAPLLLLPAAPAAELAGLWSSAASAPCGEAAAWCEVVWPLLQDLAFLADGAAGASAGSAAAAVAVAEVAAHVSSFLEANGLAATAALVDETAAAVAPAASSSSASSLTTDHDGVSPLPVPLALAPSKPTLRDVLRGFRPPALESAFWAWRITQLTRSAPFMAVLVAQPFTLWLTRTAAAEPFGVAARTAVFVSVLGASDAACCIALLAHRALALRASASDAAASHLDASSGGSRDGTRDSTAAGSHVGHGSGSADHLGACRSTAAEARTVLSYKLAAALVGPLLYNLAALSAVWARFPCCKAFVGSQRTSVGAFLTRGVLLPSVQQAGWAAAVAGGLVLFPGEVRHLTMLQPDWSSAHVAVVVMAWRLTAVAVAAAWEWRARCRFLGRVAAGAVQVEGDLSATLGITQLFLLSYLAAVAARGAALPSFPAGAGWAAKALHMLRNAPWYLFVRPTLARDWALLGCALDMYGVPLLLLVLGAAGRRSALWRWWAGGARDWVMLAHAPLARTLLHAATYVLLPRHRWTQAGYALSTISAVTRPVENTLFLTVYCWYVPIRFSLAVPLSVANLVFTFLMAYVVGPVLLPDDGSAASAQLLSRLPLMRQLLVAVVAAACPALAAWVAEKQLRAGYARVRQHPGSFEQYGTRLAASTAASLLGATSGASVTGCVVVRGCAQLIAWRHALRRPAEDSGGGGGDGVWSLSGLLSLLPQLLPDAELVGGVSVQAQAGAEREGGAEGGVEVRRWSPSASSSAPLSAPMRLLHLQPPALALLPPAGAEAKGAGAAGMGAEACGELRVTVASPRAQRCRLLLLGSGGVVLAEYGTELAAGEQELRVGVADVLRAAEAAGAPSGQAPLALRLALVPPAHSDEGGPGSSDGPLLHFSAPLLLLPAAPAAELAGLWSSAASAPCGEAAAWCEVVWPLLQDLAFLADGASAGSAAAAVAVAEVAAHVSSFLEANGLAATAALVDETAAAVAPAASSSSASSLTTDHDGVSPLPAPLALAPSKPTLRDVLRGFRPPALESAFWAWRITQLTRSAPFMAVLVAQPFMLGLLRTAAVESAVITFRNALLAVVLWASDSACCIALMLHRARARRARAGANTVRQIENQVGDRPSISRGDAATSDGSSAAVPSGAGSMAAEAAAGQATLWHKLAAALVGPILYGVAALAADWAQLPSKAFVGSLRVILGACLTRGVLLPSAQQAGLAAFAVAAPLLVIGEAHHLTAFQPTWGLVPVAAVAVGWRLTGLVVTAAWEWRARRHFLGLVAAGVVHVESVAAVSAWAKAKVA
ncbi:hypothetical protein HYH03_001054 [Edaphochlamys debaryana]|uniref:Uncharacterized protein n=1 Tax=Edaphochlamys debaryana TaxID=47281 RepID=A0A835YGD9_9CHLO|nr:hypothetical protein HYH03_001054 [Edaphochlamys debaryana]|eukprot:KAG2501247.1 hypothetical protein HYH03_001054 [Edaphochlamys debaryana]